MSRIWSALVAHPELVPHYFSRRQIGPEAMRLGGAVLLLLREAGIEEEEAGRAMRSLMVFAIGSAAIQLPRIQLESSTKTERSRLRDEKVAIHERSEADFRAGLGWFVGGLANGSAGPDATA
jgi:hypothetical protein